MDTTDVLIVLAVVINAMLVGAGLDQHIKQLPARHRIGVVAFSEYSKAADLRNGVAWYASLGIGAAVLALTAAVLGLLNGPGPGSGGAVALWSAITCTVVHSFITSRAAPISFSQRKVAGDDEQLAAIFNRFTRVSSMRVVFQILTLAALVWALSARS